VEDPRTDVERLADVLGWKREKVYRNLRRMPGAHKTNPGSTPNNKSWWEIPTRKSPRASGGQA
jgi:hypothetical protein